MSVRARVPRCERVRVTKRETKRERVRSMNEDHIARDIKKEKHLHLLSGVPPTREQHPTPTPIQTPTLTPTPRRPPTRSWSVWHIIFFSRLALNNRGAAFPDQTDLLWWIMALVIFLCLGSRMRESRFESVFDSSLFDFPDWLKSTKPEQTCLWRKLRRKTWLSLEGRKNEIRTFEKMQIDARCFGKTTTTTKRSDLKNNG